MIIQYTVIESEGKSVILKKLHKLRLVSEMNPIEEDYCDWTEELWKDEHLRLYTCVHDIFVDVSASIYVRLTDGFERNHHILNYCPYTVARR